MVRSGVGAKRCPLQSTIPDCRPGDGLCVGPDPAATTAVVNASAAKDIYAVADVEINLSASSGSNYAMLVLALLIAVTILVAGLLIRRRRHRGGTGGAAITKDVEATPTLDAWQTSMQVLQATSQSPPAQPMTMWEFLTARDAHMVGGATSPPATRRVLDQSHALPANKSHLLQEFYSGYHSNDREVAIKYHEKLLTVEQQAALELQLSRQEVGVLSTTS